MTPDQIRQHINTKYAADILVGKYKDRSEAWSHAINEVISLCTSNEERRTGETTEQVRKVSTMERWTA